VDALWKDGENSLYTWLPEELEDGLSSDIFKEDESPRQRWYHMMPVVYHMYIEAVVHEIG
jgi:hypothetical protein